MSKLTYHEYIGVLRSRKVSQPASALVARLPAIAPKGSLGLKALWSSMAAALVVAGIWMYLHPGSTAVSHTTAATEVMLPHQSVALVINQNSNKPISIEAQSGRGAAKYVNVADSISNQSIALCKPEGSIIESNRNVGIPGPILDSVSFADLPKRRISIELGMPGAVSTSLQQSAPLRLSSLPAYAAITLELSDHFSLKLAIGQTRFDVATPSQHLAYHDTTIRAGNQFYTSVIGTFQTQQNHSTELANWASVGIRWRVNEALAPFADLSAGLSTHGLILDQSLGLAIPISDRFAGQATLRAEELRFSSTAWSMQTGLVLGLSYCLF